MSSVKRVLSCAAIAAVLFLSSTRLTGQIPELTERGRSFALAGAEDMLPAALDRVDAMLSAGELDIATLQEDTVIPGRMLERLGQRYQGLPVFDAQVVRQVDGRSVVSIMGRLYEGIDLDYGPAIAPERAKELGVAAAPLGAHVRGETILGVLAVPGGDYRLAYRMEVRSDWTKRDVYVDAVTGAILRSINKLQSQAAIGKGDGFLGGPKKISVNQVSSTYEARDVMRPARTVTFDFKGSFSRLAFFLITGDLFTSDVATDSDNEWEDGSTVDAHVYHGWVYDYYFKRFGRRGIDDRNRQVDGIVHPVARSQAAVLPPDIVGDFINNALYLGDGLLVYGDGDGKVFSNLAGGLDVVAHEWSHGVTEFGSNLTYEDESGALNEAFSDIMAASMEFYSKSVTGQDRADWLIGEDVTLVSPGYLRSLNDPNAVGHPDHYSLRRFIGTDRDNGGVHFNMTIATHAFYLAVAGGRNRVSGITVAGVGMSNIERLEKIFYRAFVLLMGPASRFSDARVATLQAATDLYGSGSPERAQIALAWTAVGVN
ncbi:MAG TPA: M4 family metallopeptidase [Vicinamibacterales bacterium]|nr:M4 family metallopeptidase [Vicinamibacterales bacterium]